MDAAIHRILAATDLSEFSPVLLREAVKVARQCHAELTVLHVYRPEDYQRAFAETKVPIDEYVENLRAEMRYQVMTLEERGIGIPVRFEVREATDVIEEILFEATRTNADLIVMGTRGRSGLPLVLLGSVAEAVLRHAPVPVLVVPTAVLSRASRTVRETAAGRVSHG